MSNTWYIEAKHERKQFILILIQIFTEITLAFKGQMEFTWTFIFLAVGCSQSLEEGWGGASECIGWDGMFSFINSVYLILLNSSSLLGLSQPQHPVELMNIIPCWKPSRVLLLSEIPSPLDWEGVCSYQELQSYRGNLSYNIANHLNQMNISCLIMKSSEEIITSISHWLALLPKLLHLLL